MTVCLIVPPSGFQLDERVYPMLGVLKVAAVLEDAQVRVSVLDLSGISDLETAIQNARPVQVFGISATMPQMPAAFRITQAIRTSHPAARVILGGAHPTMVNAAARRGVARSQAMLDVLLKTFDAVVAGDGEAAVFYALQDRGLIDADRPGTTLFLTPDQVAQAPWPARHLIDLASYHCVVGGLPGTSIIGQLGCPFRCGFCGGRNSPTFRRVRLRPPEDVAAEVEEIYQRFGYRGFMFLDDELNVSRAFPELLKLLIAAQERLGVEWRFCGLLKSELFTDEQATLMYAAGFRKVLIGFESGDPRMLANMQKVATADDNTAAVARAHRAGLKVKALMSLGHPGESAASIRRTQDWLLQVRPDEFDATVITVYPGTPYHDEAYESDRGVWTYRAKTGDQLHALAIDQAVDTPFYKGIPGQYRAYVWTDHLRPADLVELRDALETEVRSELGIPWPSTAAETQYEHSMGAR